MGGDLASHLHMFLIGLRNNSFNLVAGVAIFHSQWYFCPYDVICLFRESVDWERHQNECLI